MKKITILLMFLGAFSYAHSQDVKVTGKLSGASEVPAAKSSASGTFSGVLNPETRVLKFTLTYSGITPSAGHIHKGAAGANGPVVIPFTSVAKSPVTQEVTLTPEQLTDLKTNLLYTNLHTAAFPGGEIRGQLAIVK